jgi:hypothetical protein
VSGLLSDVDSLFETAVMTPDALTEQMITDWWDAVSVTTDLDKQSAKLLRRVVRAAQKLAAFWATDTRAGDSDLDWRTRVDIAMGPRAWRPVLDISQHLLETHPTEEAFVSVGGLFRIVNGETWMDGASYDEWRAESGRS